MSVNPPGYSRTDSANGPSSSIGRRSVEARPPDRSIRTIEAPPLAAERLTPVAALIDSILGDTGLPWHWEYPPAN